MKTIKIAVSSITYAEKGRRALAAQRIPARITRLAPGEAPRGCAFAVAVEGCDDVLRLRDILLRAHVRFSDFLVEES